MELRIFTRRRAVSIVAPCLFVIRRLFVCGGRALTAIITVAVSTQHLHRHRHRRSPWPLAVLSLSQSPPSLSAQLLILQTSHRIHEAQLLASSPVCRVVRYCSEICKGHISKDTQREDNVDRKEVVQHKIPLESNRCTLVSGSSSSYIQ